MNKIKKLSLDEKDALFYSDNADVDHFDKIKHLDGVYDKIFKKEIVPYLGTNSEWNSGNIKLLYLYLTKQVWFLARNIPEPLILSNKDEMEDYFVVYESDDDPLDTGFARWKYSDSGRDEFTHECFLQKDFPDLLVVLPSLKDTFSKDDILKSLESYLNDNFSDITEGNFADKDWIKSHLSGYNLSIYLDCFSSCEKIVRLFEKKMPSYNAMKDLYRSELDDLELKFKEEKGFYSLGMIRNHPLYGSLFLEIEKKKEGAMSELVLSSDEALCKYIDSFPLEFKVICIRKVIGIEKIINFELDSYLSFEI